MDSLPQPELEVIPLGRTTVVDGIEYPLECKLTPYTYEPITAPNGIRLLRVYAREKGLDTPDGIIPLCQLVDTTLDESAYVAVSYAWGDLHEYRTVPLTGNKFVNVTKSLYALLCRLCPEQGYLPIWADQLCINQRDDKERSMQVQLISDIFEHAAGVSVWLGDSDETTPSAVDLIERLDCPEFSNVNKFRAEKVRAELEQTLRKHGIELGEKEPGWSAIRRLSGKAWFTRLWTFQEVVVPKHVNFLCGSYDLTLPSIYRAFTVAAELGTVSANGYDNIYSTVLHRMKYRQGRTHLIDLLRDTSNGSWKCTDWRDRIYAIIGLQSRESPCEIPIDYSRPLLTVFEDAANGITRSRKSLSILYRPYRNLSPDGPSWVPSWWADNFSASINDDPPQTMFDCSKGLVHTFEEAAEGHLIVRGKAVSHVSEVMTHRFADRPFGRDYDAVYNYIGVDSLLPALQARFDAYVGHGETSEVSKATYLNWLLSTTLSRGYYRDMDPAQFAAEGPDDPGDLAALLMTKNPFGVFMMCKCSTRRIAILDRHPFTIALVPESAQADDLICVLHGANVPVVLRKVSGGFEFVGDCYVHGIMYGEALAWSQHEGDSFDLI